MPAHQRDCSGARRHRVRHPRQPACLRGRARRHRRDRLPGAVVPGRSRRLRRGPRRLCRPGARARDDLPGRQPRSGRAGHDPARAVLRAGRRSPPPGPRRRSAPRPGSTCRASSPRTWRRRRPSITPAPATRCGSTCSLRCRPSCASTSRRGGSRSSATPTWPCRSPGCPGAPATGQTRGAEEELDLTEGEWLVNPGSVGQPRDGDPRAAWMELDLDAWHAPCIGAPNTTSTGRRRRSGPRGCRIRWLSACSTGSSRAAGSLTPRQRGQALQNRSSL